MNPWHFILDHLPKWCRDKWPMKRFYWQQEELDAAVEWAKKMHEKLWH
jgi:hypothetical protein